MAEGSLRLQIIDLYEHDNPEYEICLFGKSLTGESICVRVAGYKPFFYTSEPTPTGEECQKKLFREYQPRHSTFYTTACDTLRSYHSQVRELFSSGIEVSNVDIPPMLKFCHERDINTCGWITVDCYDRVKSPISTCTIEVLCDASNIHPLESHDISAVLIASFDIEATSTDVTKFPIFTNDGDCIIQIGTTLQTFPDGPVSRYIFVLGACEDIPNTTVVRCKSESHLLEEWFTFIRTTDPDILVGYNILGFDYEYIFERAMRLRMVRQACSLSRIRNPMFERDIKRLLDYSCTEECAHKHLSKILQKVYRQNKQFKYIVCTGRVNLDLLKYCRDNGDRLSNYKLDTVAKHYGLKQGKLDMPYRKIFEIYQSEGHADLKRQVAEYCVQDCNLCLELLHRLNVVPNCIGMANTCFIPLSFLFIRGQGIRTYSLLMKECTDQNYVIPKRPKTSGPTSYKGATVLNAMQGFHAVPVCVLDFASLYPSSMISHNLCPSTKLRDDQWTQMDPSEYFMVEWTDKIPAEYFNERISPQILKDFPSLKSPQLFGFGKRNTITQSFRHKLDTRILTLFQQNRVDFFEAFKIDFDRLCLDPDGTGCLIRHRHYYIKPLHDLSQQGIIPRILTKLLNARNETKKLKSKYKQSDPFLSKIYDGLQLSYKITANSVYGQLGASFGAFANLDIAGSCTAVGRSFLIFAQETIKQLFPESKAIYGDTDSVFMQFQLQDHEEKCPNQETQLVHIRELMVDRIKSCRPCGELCTAPQPTFMLQCTCPKMHARGMLQESIRLAKHAEAIVSSMLPCAKVNSAMGVHDLEYEKTFFPFILFTKKKYVGKQFFMAEDDGAIKHKGIVLARRDNCPLLKTIYYQCLELILNHEFKAAVQQLDRCLLQMRDDHYAIEEFVITTQLRNLKELKEKSSTLPHYMLAERVKARDPGNAYHAGDRIPYCFIEVKSKQKNTLQGERIETPEYIRAKKLPLDYLYYIEHQLHNPIQQLFEAIGMDKESEKIFCTHSRILFNQQRGLRPITDFFSPRAPLKT